MGAFQIFAGWCLHQQGHASWAVSHRPLPARKLKMHPNKFVRTSDQPTDVPAKQENFVSNA